MNFTFTIKKKLAKKWKMKQTPKLYKSANITNTQVGIRNLYRRISIFFLYIFYFILLGRVRLSHAINEYEIQRQNH